MFWSLFILCGHSTFVAQIKIFCSNLVFFVCFFLLLLLMFAKDLTGCFSDCCVEGAKKNTSHGNEVLPQALRISYKDHVSNDEVCSKIQQAVG